MGNVGFQRLAQALGHRPDGMPASGRDDLLLGRRTRGGSHRDCAGIAQVRGRCARPRLYPFKARAGWNCRRGGPCRRRDAVRQPDLPHGTSEHQRRRSSQPDHPLHPVLVSTARRDCEQRSGSGATTCKRFQWQRFHTGGGVCRTQLGSWTRPCAASCWGWRRSAVRSHGSILRDRGRTGSTRLFAHGRHGPTCAENEGRVVHAMMSCEDSPALCMVVVTTPSELAAAARLVLVGPRHSRRTQ